MLTFDDVKNMRRGREAEIEEQSSQIAARKLEEIANRENQQTEEIEQQSLQSDAQKIIQELQSNPDLNPEEVINSLPPVLQQAVFEQMGAVPPEEELQQTIEEPTSLDPQEQIQRKL